MKKRKRRKKRRKGVPGVEAGHSQTSVIGRVGSQGAETQALGPLAVHREGVWDRSGEVRGRWWRRKGKEGVAAPPRGTHGHERGPDDGVTPRWSCRY